MLRELAVFALVVIAADGIALYLSGWSQRRPDPALRVIGILSALLTLAVLIWVAVGR